MVRLLRTSDIEDRPFAARRLTEKLVREVDLVLALTRAHRSLVVDVWPPAVRRTFTLREFASLMKDIGPFDLPDGTPAERLRGALPMAMAGRSLRRPLPWEDDVVDPFRQGDDIYAASFAEITAAVDVIETTLVLRPLD